ncbi:MAG: hypothetical protein SNI45_00705 [Rikenellaceae bacterium]
MNRVSIILFSAIACAFASCETEDAQVYSESEILEGNKALAAIVETAFADNDKAKVESAKEDTYYYSVDDLAEADEFVSAVTCGEYSEDNPSYVLPAGFGQVDVTAATGENTGYFYVIDFDIIGYSGIRYILAAESFIEARTVN